MNEETQEAHHDQQQEPTQNTDTNTTTTLNITIPDVCWEYVLTYLNVNELCNIGLVNKVQFYVWSINNKLWKKHCMKRWKNKQGINFILNTFQPPSFLPQHLQLPSSQSLSNTSTTSDAFTTVTNSKLSWKQCYAWIEYDMKYRPYITREEIVYYKWKLLYNGRESTLGLREFKNDGTYNSPYMGLCQWSLDTMNNRFLVMNMSLPIERSIVGTNHGCGWIIGKGSNTVYYSIEEEEEE